MENLKSTATKLATNVKLYWKIPPKGNYMPYKEILAYAGGGIGVQFICVVLQQMILSTNNTLIGNTIGVAPKTMYLLYVIGILCSIPLSGLRANIIDNTRGKEGKYRPYILKMGLPLAILACAFIWFPYERIDNNIIVCGVVLAFNIVFQFFYYFFFDSYENLIHVLSPNSQERTNVSAFKAIVYSLAPTIVNFATPLVAGAFFDGDMTNINLYRWMFPPMLCIGFFGSLYVYANTKEKVVQAKTHVAQIRFIDALRAVAKNKYFWIIALASWLAFLEGAQTSIMYWLYQYGHACTSTQYTLIVLLYGNASLWGMLWAPGAIKRYGKKKVLVVTNLFNILFIAALIPFIDSIWLVLIFMYLNSVAGAFMHILNPAIQADIRDYQHYVTGERIDGMFLAVGVISSVIGLFTSSAIPLIQDKMGVNEANAAALGYTNAWDVLYEPEIYSQLITVLILVAVLGAVLNVLPYFFYDLTEVRQKAIIKVLKIRAMFEDFGNDVLDDRDIVESLDIIHKAEEMANKEPVPVTKDGIKAAKREPKSDEKRAHIKAAKKAWLATKEYNEEIEIGQFVLKELHKFETPEMQTKVAIAKELRRNGLAGLSQVDPALLKNAKRLPKNTKEEKLLRKEELEAARARYRSKKLIIKHFEGTLTKYDRTPLNDLYDQLNECEDALTAAYEKLKRARKKDDKAAVAEANKQVKEIRDARKSINSALTKENKIFSLYHSAARPYLDAKRLMIEEENYKHYNEIEAKYEEAKIQAAELDRLEKERLAQEEAENKAFEEELKAQKKIDKEKKAKDKEKAKTKK